jgi:hypothetical protein
MRFLQRAVGVLYIALACASAGAQQVADPGLTFQFKQFDFRRLNMGMPQLVYASGAIKAGDLARLAAFNVQSAVGRGARPRQPRRNVFEAMAIARYIRSIGMDTSIGARPTAPDAVSGPGGCYSACTLLFLGRVHRSVGTTSSFGVHRFFWIGADAGGSDVAQIVFGQIVSFVKEMGADPGLTVEMSRSGRDEINILPASKMAQLDVTTPVFETTWSVEPVDRTFIVHSVTRDLRGLHHLTFTCSTSGKDHHAHLLMIAGFDAGGSAQAVVAGLKKEQVILDGGRFLDLSDQEMPNRELMINPVAHRHVDSFIRVTPRLLALVDRSTEIGVAYNMSDG